MELVFEERVANVEIVCDQNRLAQVISNLLNNAGKFTEEGAIRFGFDLKDGCVEFFVQDTGMGIPPREGAQYLRPVRQTQRFRVRHGTRLAISKMIVEKLDGTIGVDSEPGKGTRFHFSIPSSTGTAAKTTSSFAPPRAGTTASRGCCWSPRIRTPISDSSKPSSAAASASCVPIRSRGRDMFGTVQPDAVLMDIRMPVMDGP